MNAVTAGEPLAARRSRGRRTLLLLAFIAAAPFFAGWLFYVNPQWLPQPSAQHGRLLEPPRALADYRLDGLDGKPLPAPAGTATWQLLLVENGPCENACRDRVHATRQARRATGVDRDRVVRTLVLAQPPDAETRGFLVAHSPRLRLAVGDADLRALAGGAGGYLLGDPHGDLVLGYANDVPAEDLLKDVKRLLRVSRSW